MSGKVNGQRCDICKRSTGRSAKNALTAYDDDLVKTLVLCDSCYEEAIKEQEKREKAGRP